jgi:hypothetical protein
VRHVRIAPDVGPGAWLGRMADSFLAVMDEPANGPVLVHCFAGRDRTGSMCAVYRLIGECIKEAKRRRQIILVTHNPNLAVTCDAEQVVHAQLDPQAGNKITYTAGGIENPEINRVSIDILEGTRPAFDNRDAKYFAETR